jgi:hypothetical protein
MIVTLGWIGILLRVHHETQTRGRLAAQALRREGAGA